MTAQLCKFAHFEELQLRGLRFSALHGPIGSWSTQVRHGLRRGQATLPRKISSEMIRIVDPPREIPFGLQLQILMHRDVSGSVLFSSCRCGVVAGAMKPGTGAQFGLLVPGSILLVTG